MRMIPVEISNESMEAAKRFVRERSPCHCLATAEVAFLEGVAWMFLKLKESENETNIPSTDLNHSDV